MAMSGGGHGLKPSFERLCRWPHKPRDLLKGSVQFNVKFLGQTQVAESIQDETSIHRVIEVVTAERKLSEKGKKKQLPDAELIMSNEQIRITKAVEKTITIFEFDSCGTEKCADNPARSYLILGVKLVNGTHAYVFAGQNDLIKLVKLTLSQQFEMYGLHSNADRIERLAGQEANVTSTNLLQNAVKHQFGTMCSHFEKKLGKALHVLTGMTKKAAATEKQKENAQLFEYARDVHKSLLIVLWQMHEIVDELKRFKGDMNGENGETTGHPPSFARSPTHDLFTNYESPRTLPRSYKERPRPPSLPTTPVPPPPLTIDPSSPSQTFFGPKSPQSANSDRRSTSPRSSNIPVASAPKPSNSNKFCAANKTLAAELLQRRNAKKMATKVEAKMEAVIQEQAAETLLPAQKESNHYGEGVKPEPLAGPSGFTAAPPQKPVPMPRSPPAIVLSDGPPSSSQPSLQQLEAEVKSLAVVKEESDSEFEEMDDLKVGRGTATSNQKIYQDLFEEESHYE